MKPVRLIIVLLILSLTAAASFAVPVTRVKRSFFLDDLSIPLKLTDWQGEDVSRLVDTGNDRYRFINDMFVRVYSYEEKSLLFLILDAENFHHPRTCFSSSGFSVEELKSRKVTAGGRAINAKVVYAHNNEEAFIVLYWMTIDGQYADWHSQKWRQLWHTILSQPDTGVMVRLDVPVKNDIHEAVNTAELFLNDIVNFIPARKADYIFGKRMEMVENEQTDILIK